MTSVTEAAPPAAGPGRQDRLERYDRFVDHIRKLCREDAGPRAALRSGLRRPVTQSPRMHAFVAPWAPSNNEAVERAYYAIAAMIAAQARDARDTNLNAATAGNAAHAVGTPVTPVPAETPPGEEAAHRPSLGETLGRAVSAKLLKDDTTEKRLHLVVRQGVDGVHRQLPGLVQHLRSEGVPVDWGQLLFDLAQWERFRDRVAKRWLQDYYRAVYTRRNDTSDAPVGGTDPGSATTPSTGK